MGLFTRRQRLPTELLPCPFCGHRPQLRESFGRLAAGCQTKGCIQPDTWLTCHTTSLETLAQVWNRRPPNAPAEQEEIACASAE